MEEENINVNELQPSDHNLLALIVDVNPLVWSGAGMNNSCLSYEKVLECLISFLNAYILLDRNALLVAIANILGNT